MSLYHLWREVFLLYTYYALVNIWFLLLLFKCCLCGGLVNYVPFIQTHRCGKELFLRVFCRVTSLMWKLCRDRLPFGFLNFRECKIFQFALFKFLFNFNFEIFKFHFYSVIYISIVHVLLCEKSWLIPLSFFTLILNMSSALFYLLHPDLLVFLSPLICGRPDVPKLCVFKVALTYARLCCFQSMPAAIFI